MKKFRRELIILILFFVALAGLTGFLLWQKSRAPISVTPEPKAEPLVCESFDRLDGTCLSQVDDQDAVFYYSVMIENHSDARPVSGLNRARLVYETLAEAPITRFLAIFKSSDDIKEIGPVRSARKYYVQWASEFYGPYVHVGGSPEALFMLSADYPFDLNEFYNGHYFWRDSRRSAPHNAYTSSELLIKAATDKNWNLADQKFDSWLYKDELKIEERPATGSVRLDFGSPGYQVDWQYNREANDYLRFIAGDRDQTRDGQELRAKNIAVMYTDSEVIDNEGRRATRALGSGEAAVFLDGREVLGTWQRENLSDRTKFFDQAGAEIQFNAGTTWIEIVPDHFERAVFAHAL